MRERENLYLQCFLVSVLSSSRRLMHIVSVLIGVIFSFFLSLAGELIQLDNNQYE